MFDEVAHALKHPLIDRHAEALLPATDDTVGDDAFERPLENVFRLTVAQLQMARQAHRELDQLVIEKRHARFDRSRHRHLVNAHQQQLRQPQFQLKIDHAFQLIGLRLRLEQAFKVGAHDRVRRQSAAIERFVRRRRLED